MKIHLFWIDKNWKRNGGVANNYNLIVDMENKTYKVFINHNRAEDIEVKKKSDIMDYVEYLKLNGFKEVKSI